MENLNKRIPNSHSTSVCLMKLVSTALLVCDCQNLEDLLLLGRLKMTGD